MPNRQTELFVDGLAEKLSNDFVARLQAEGLTDHQIQVAVARMHYRHVRDQLQKFPANIRDRWILWLVEDFLGNTDD